MLRGEIGIYTIGSGRVTHTFDKPPIPDEELRPQVAPASMELIQPAEDLETILDQTQDVSKRVQDLMRKIDRLPPGRYEIVIEKPEMRAMDWTARVERLEKIDTFRLSKYNPE